MQFVSMREFTASPKETQAKLAANSELVVTNNGTPTSEQFGSENRWGKFWSLGAGWNLHREAFMEDVDWLDEQTKQKTRLSSAPSSPVFAKHSIYT